MPKKLPPDPEGMNELRAHWAGAAIEAFRESHVADEEMYLGDMLCDLRHWCDRNGKDWDSELYRARASYKEETADKNDESQPGRRMRAICDFFRELSAITKFRENIGDENYLPAKVVSKIRAFESSPAVLSGDFMAIRGQPYKWCPHDPDKWLWMLHRYTNRYSK